MDRLSHPFPPLYDAESRILILGSFPSVKSREAMFFYGHPQNRFWPLLALLTGEPTPQTVEEKRALALRHHFALWDSIGQCTITGSSDSSIRDVVPNDLRAITEHAPIERIFCNGNTSLKYYRRYNEPLLGRPAVVTAAAGRGLARDIINGRSQIRGSSRFHFLRITRWPGYGCLSARAWPAARARAHCPAQRSSTAASRAPDGAG